MMDEREFEQSLRDALRPVEAPAGLADRIIAKANARRRRPAQLWMRWGAIAALLTIGTFLGVKWYEERQAQQMAARKTAEQLTVALSIASRKIVSIEQRLVVEVPLSHRNN
jgi:cobalamin biosynthesis protein CobD/CbiB